MVISAYVSYILLSSNYKYKLEKMSENTTSLTYFKKISYKVRNPTNYISYTVYSYNEIDRIKIIFPKLKFIHTKMFR